MGAGGMIFVDPLFQRVLVDMVRTSPTFARNAGTSPDWSGLPVIFDEVFAGLYRLGMESTTSVLGVYPDISVNAKILTGGLVPLAVTLASESIFNAFYGDDKADALLHGHSYTAYPVGCEVANESLDIISKMATSQEWADAKEQWQAGESQAVNVWSFWDPKFIDALSKCEAVGEVMTLGTVLALKVAGDGQGTYLRQLAANNSEHSTLRIPVPLGAEAPRKPARCHRRRRTQREWHYALRHQLPHVGECGLLHAELEHSASHHPSHRKQDMENAPIERSLKFVQYIVFYD